jgi:hypothetical protein
MNIIKHNRGTDLLHASSSALQHDVGTGDDGNSRRKYCHIARTFHKET